MMFEHRVLRVSVAIGAVALLVSLCDGAHYRIVMAPRAPVVAATTAPVVPISGLVGHWKLNDSNATATVTDSGTNVINGACYSGTTTAGYSVPGKFNSAFSFTSAQSSYFTITADAKIQNTQQSWSLWINSSDSFSSYPLAISAPSFHQFYLQFFPTGAIESGWFNGTYRYLDTTNIPSLQDGNWHHIVSTFDGTNIRIYFDGALSGTSGNLSATPPLKDATTFYVASYVGFSGSKFVGKIDDIRIYNRALSLSEVQTLYTGGEDN